MVEAAVYGRTLAIVWSPEYGIDLIPADLHLQTKNGNAKHSVLLKNRKYDAQCAVCIDGESLILEYYESDTNRKNEIILGILEIKHFLSQDKKPIATFDDGKMSSPIDIYWLDSEYSFEDLENRLIEEGAPITVIVNRYERDPAARAACIKKNGAKCKACEFDFEKVYGQHGAGFIHVHHKVDLSLEGRRKKIDPEKDLVPLCPNCHAMIHRHNMPAMSLEALQGLIQKNRKILI